MGHFTKTALGGSLAAAMLLSSVGVASAASKAYNTGPAQGSKGVQIQAAGNSGWAVVDGGGTLVRKLNAKSVSHDDTGSYIVAFNSNIRSCAYTGTVGLSGSSSVSDPGYITVVGANSNVKAVYVQVFNSAGDLSDTIGFHLLVTC